MQVHRQRLRATQAGSQSFPARQVPTGDAKLYAGVARQSTADASTEIPIAAENENSHISGAYQLVNGVPSWSRNAPLCLGVSAASALRIEVTLCSTVRSAPAPPMSVFTQPGEIATIVAWG